MAISMREPAVEGAVAAGGAVVEPRMDAAMAVSVLRGQLLLRCGALLFLLGMLTGFVLPLVENPRMALSSHLEGLMNGLFLAVLGLAWSRLRLSTRAERWVVGLALYGTYANWATTLIASIFGTSRSTPIAGAGHAGELWQEALVDFGLFSLSASMVVTMVLVLRGLGRARAAICSRA